MPLLENLSYSEQLDPETQNRLARRIAIGKELQEGPLETGLAAKIAQQGAIGQQVAATSGATPEKAHWVAQKGAEVAPQILTQYGTPMVNETMRNFAERGKAALDAVKLDYGQSMHALARKIQQYLATQGININQQQAWTMAGSVAMSMTAELAGGDDETTPSDSGTSGAGWQPGPSGEWTAE